MRLHSNPGWKKLSRVESQNYVPLPQASSATRQPSWPHSPTIGVKDRLKGRSIVSNCSNANRMGVLDLTCCDIGCWLEVHELSTEDDGEPQYRGKVRD